MAKKGDKKKDRATARQREALVSISQHPRAKAGIRRARTRAAFIAFIAVFALNVMGDQALFDAVWRALVAGIVVNVVVWRCAIVVWRHIVLNELAAGRRAPAGAACACSASGMEKLAGRAGRGAAAS